jgi:nucleotide-binding universal stress UspA family protein
MYKRILIPTDGSKVARKAITGGIELARELGASVVGYYALEAMDRGFYAEGVSARPATIKQARERLAKEGEEYLAEIDQACEAAGVVCESVISTPASPYQGIIEAARKKRCDLIFMASHGRGALATLLLGSVTQKVLAHSKIPVLVHR